MIIVILVLLLISDSKLHSELIVLMILEILQKLNETSGVVNITITT